MSTDIGNSAGIASQNHDILHPDYLRHAIESEQEVEKGAQYQARPSPEVK